MGKLIDKLGRIGRAGPRIGFGAANDSRDALMGIVAVLRSADAALAKQAVTQGADAILISDHPGGKRAKGPLAKLLGVGEGVPCGAEAPASSDAGPWDFALVTTGDALDGLLTAQDLDLLLRLPAGAPEATLRALEAMPIDGVVVEAPQGPLTLDALLPCYRAAAATRKPVLAQAPLTAGAPLLTALRDAGVAAVMVEVTEATVGSLAPLRQAIKELPPKRRAKGPKPRAMVPLGLAPAGDAGAGGDDGDDGDDEDDD